MLKKFIKMIFFIGIITIIASCAAIERPIEFAVLYHKGVYKAVGQVAKNEWQRDNTSNNCGWKGGTLSTLTYYQAPNRNKPWKKLGTRYKFSFNLTKTRLFHRNARNGEYKIAVFVDIKSDNCKKPGNLLFIQEIQKKYTSEHTLKFAAKHFSLEFGGEKIQPKSIEMKFDNYGGVAKLYLYFSEKTIENQDVKNSGTEKTEIVPTNNENTSTETANTETTSDKTTNNETTSTKNADTETTSIETIVTEDTELPIETKIPEITSNNQQNLVLAEEVIKPKKL
ncbi:MAG: hypothetical protein KAH84_08535, partial [Thiomargarita sp.]|nr:hypothetical protein [Thiomargarita sp.]